MSEAACSTSGCRALDQAAGIDHRRTTSEPLRPSRKFPELLAQREGGRESAPGTCPVFRCGRVAFSISEPSVGEFALGLLAAGKVVVPNGKVLTNLDPQLHLGA